MLIKEIVSFIIRQLPEINLLQKLPSAFTLKLAYIIQFHHSSISKILKSAFIKSKRIKPLSILFIGKPKPSSIRI